MQRHLVSSRRGATAADEGRGAAAATREDTRERRGRLGGEREREATVAVLDLHRGVTAAEAARTLRGGRVIDDDAYPPYGRLLLR